MTPFPFAIDRENRWDLDPNLNVTRSPAKDSSNSTVVSIAVQDSFRNRAGQTFERISYAAPLVVMALSGAAGYDLTRTTIFTGTAFVAGSMAAMLAQGLQHDQEASYTRFLTPPAYGLIGIAIILSRLNACLAEQSGNS